VAVSCGFLQRTKERVGGLPEQKMLGK